MQKYIKIPYGLANFETLAKDNFYYADRTNFIEKLENLGERNLMYLRPRRFGKSLFVSMLKYHYDIRQAEKFDAIFGKYYIGKNPTPLKNNFLILSFDFSGILTETEEKAHNGFLFKIKLSVCTFFENYFPSESENIRKQLEKISEPNEAIGLLLQNEIVRGNQHKIYLIIDEYDHFANELITWNVNIFKKVVSMNGWVRKFYEVIKTASGDGIVDRIFITGVSPITLDSLTSGFNIMKFVSNREDLHEMMGFTDTEVREVLAGVGITETQMPAAMENLKNWYDGYLFCENIEKQRLYNPDMVLYFASEYLPIQKYPRKMLDINIMSDYGKIRRLFQIDNGEDKRLAILEELLQNGQTMMKMTDQFSFSYGFTDRDFVSLLYYMGVITIKDILSDETVFCIPNYVIKQLYFEYFGQVLAEKTDLTPDSLGYRQAIRAMTFNNDFMPLVNIVSKIMEKMSNRDNMNFGEKHLKSIFMAILMTSEAYYIHSELEVNKMYIDLFIEKSIRFNIPYQYLIEFKYYSKTEYLAMTSKPKKSRSKKVSEPEKPQITWAEEIQAARNQLDNYTQSDFFQQKEDLKSWLIMFVGHEAEVVEMR
ncbi:MAG: AAA family ATPase [Bacteroidia bacterium]